MSVESRTLVPAVRRRLSAGVELHGADTARVRVWAPACGRVDFVIQDGPTQPLERGGDGFFEAMVEGVRAGTRYWFRLDGDRLRPDPVSRYQPEGPNGPSAIVDPMSFEWTDQTWRGVEAQGQVLYEMHVGTFTPEGTWSAAAAQLPELAALGITVIEMMPIADFAGRFGWGYDGVNLYAPSRLYGTPDALRAFVNRAHETGLGVILDVVYNHLGPDGNYLPEFSPDYFTARHRNDWGPAINFEGPAHARSYFVENAGYWIDEFHFDGLRLDATQDIKDASNEHVIASIARRAREAAGSKTVYLIAENEPQDTQLVRPPSESGCGLDALWNDDFHHSAVVALTGRREAYYTDYKGSVQELVSVAKYGYLYQGQWYSWQKQPRGTFGLDLPAYRFVAYLENHDQVANSVFGRRLHQQSAPGRHRALTALTLLGPATPMLFQGQEFSSSAPFLFFADHREQLRESIRSGRREFLSQFMSARDPAVSEALPSPDDEATFLSCRLDFDERRGNAATYALHRDLLRLRKSLPAINRPRRVDGAVLASEVLLLRYFGDDEDCLLIVNLGCDLDLTPAPEPLLAAPRDRVWQVRWSSESVEYGGGGTAPIDLRSVPHLIGESAVLLCAGRPEAGAPPDEHDDD
jgi:maltooligosyltrehalose trehalohydrolase